MNRIHPISAEVVNLSEYLFNPLEDIYENLQGNMFEMYNFLDMFKLLSNSSQYTVNLKHVHCGGNSYGQPVARITVAFQYNESGWKDSEGNPCTMEVSREAIIKFCGDGIVEIYSQIYDNKYVRASYDDHNWRIEDPDYALRDLIESFAKEYQKLA